MSENQQRQQDTATAHDGDEQNETQQQQQQQDENETLAAAADADDGNKNNDTQPLQTESAAASVVTVSNGERVDDQPASATDAAASPDAVAAVTTDGAQPPAAAAAAPKVKRRKHTAEKSVEVAEKVKCVSCGQSDKNRLDEAEDMICCAVCSNSGHPTCLDLTAEMIPIIRSYEWQCMDCKTCVKCMNPHDEDQMMFCDHCDRGYHTFCVGLWVIPAGRWECPSCDPASVVAVAPPKPKKRGRPFKYPRPAVTQTPKTVVAAEPTETAEQQ